MDPFLGIDTPTPSFHPVDNYVLNSVTVSLTALAVRRGVQDSRVRAGVLEDLQHAGAGDVPHVRAELLPVQDHQVLQTVGPRPSQLLVVCGGRAGG